MKILHVVRQFHPAVGGLESYVKSLALEQQKLGHKCAVLTLDKVFHGSEGALAPREVVDGIDVHRVSFLGRRRFFLPLVQRSFFARYDIIHVHNTDGFFDMVSLVACRKGRPVFATTHGGFFHTKDLALFKKLYFRLVTSTLGRRYNAIFAISQNDYKIFKGVNDNIILKPNAIVPPGDYISDGPDFVYLGRLAPHKNVAALIRTFATIRRLKQAKLHIIGPEWGVTRENLRNLAQSLGVVEDVVFHGFLSSENMTEVLKKCGWFLSASSFEGFGMSMLEGMAIGLIPFVQPNESFRELISAGKVGTCVDFNAPDKAAREIVNKMAIVTPAERVRARNFAREFSWDRLAKETVEIYGKFGTYD